jgi:hypothetical protein
MKHGRRAKHGNPAEQRATNMTPAYKPERARQQGSVHRIPAEFVTRLRLMLICGSYFSCIRRCGSDPAGTRTLHRPNQLILSKILVLNLPTAFIPSSKCLTDRGCFNVERGGGRQCYRRSPK